MVLCLFSFGLEGWTATLEGQNRIKKIEIAGNKKITAKAILARIKSKVGAPLVSQTLRNDIKIIYKMGYFKDIRVEKKVDPDGVVIQFLLLERDLLTHIEYLGNEKVLTESLEGEVSLRKGDFLNESKVKENAERIRHYYEQEGYYKTQVIPVIKVLKDDKASLIFYIKEGKKAKIKGIQFEGRTALPAEDIQKTMETQEHSPFTSFLTGSGYYKKEVLDVDVERIREAYLNQGYLEVQVGSPRIDFEDSRFPLKVPLPVADGDLDPSFEYREVIARVRIPINEGKQYTIQNLDLSGNHVMGRDELLSRFDLQEGELFRQNQLRMGLATVRELYGEQGYLYADINPQFQTHPEDRTVDLHLEVSEGPQVSIRKIRITGNNKTRDKVIRRELRVNEQETINTKLLRRSFQRINNLNFFETVEITPTRVSDDQVDLSVRVTEKSTGSMSIGGGYSSNNRFVALAEVSQGNLFGKGQLLRARAEVGGRRNTYSLTVKEPYLFDREVSGTVDLFNIDRNFNTYQEQRIGGDLVLGKAFSEYLRGSVSYTLERLRLFGLSSDAPTQIVEQEGVSRTSSLRLSLSRDTRDFFFDPREGGRTSLSVEYAGTFLGGNNDFVKTILDVSRFYPLPWSMVFSLHGRFGHAMGINGKTLPAGERFYVGGINTIRGFDFGTVGPCQNDQDELVSCQEGEIIGGNSQIVLNAEFLFPLVKEAKIKGLLFFDLGRAFDHEEKLRFPALRYSAGMGMRWISPIGPLRLEWGYNLDPEPGEEASQLEFSIGTLF